MGVEAEVACRAVRCKAEGNLRIAVYKSMADATKYEVHG